MKSFYINPKIYFTEHDLKNFASDLGREVTQKDLVDFVQRAVSFYLVDLEEKVSEKANS
jgi:hypothetical protein